jgi:hypothetical protein
MLSVTREKATGQIVLSTHGVLDDPSVDALIQALTLTPESTAVLIDLSRAEVLIPDTLRRLAVELSKRSGPVKFLGPAGSRVLRPVR